MPQIDPSHELAFRRSLRASRRRRAETANQRRRALCARASALVAVAGLTTVTAGATAHRVSAPSAPGGQGGSVAAVQAALGITADGLVGPQTRRAVRAFERRRGLPVDGRIDARVRRALGVTGSSTPVKQAAESADAPAVLEAIALCESGGDPTAVSPDGRYRGKYQFTRSTWRSLGGDGDPAAAPEDEQDERAAALLAREGTSPWPACSRQVGAG